MKNKIAHLFQSYTNQKKTCEFLLDTVAVEVVGADLHHNCLQQKHLHTHNHHCYVYVREQSGGTSQKKTHPYDHPVSCCYC